MSDDIEKLLRATIQTKVIEAFNTTPEVVEKMVEAAFHKEVDETGMPPGRNSWNSTKMPWIEWLVGQEIRNAAQAAVHEYMAENRKAVKAKVVAAIEAGDFGSQIGEKVAEMMAEDYRWSFQISPKQRD